MFEPGKEGRSIWNRPLTAKGTYLIGIVLGCILWGLSLGAGGFACGTMNAKAVERFLCAGPSG